MKVHIDDSRARPRGLSAVLRCDDGHRYRFETFTPSVFCKSVELISGRILSKLAAEVDCRICCTTLMMRTCCEQTAADVETSNQQVPRVAEYRAREYSRYGYNTADDLPHTTTLLPPLKDFLVAMRHVAIRLLRVIGTMQRHPLFFKSPFTFPTWWM